MILTWLGAFIAGVGVGMLITALRFRHIIKDIEASQARIKEHHEAIRADQQIIRDILGAKR